MAVTPKSRMREFYRAYENGPSLLGEAMEIGWTQNVVILGSSLSVVLNG